MEKDFPLIEIENKVLMVRSRSVGKRESQAFIPIAKVVSVYRPHLKPNLKNRSNDFSADSLRYQGRSSRQESQGSFLLARLYANNHVHIGQQLYLIAVNNGYPQIKAQLQVRDIRKQVFFNYLLEVYGENADLAIPGQILARSIENDFTAIKKQISNIQQMVDPERAYAAYGRILEIDPNLAEAHYGQLQIHLRQEEKNVQLLQKKFTEIFALADNFYDRNQARSFFSDYYSFLIRRYSQNNQVVNFPQSNIEQRIEVAEKARKAFPQDRTFFTYLFIAHQHLIDQASVNSSKNLRKKKNQSIARNRYLLKIMLENNLYTDDSLTVAVEFIVFLHNDLRADIRNDRLLRREYREFIERKLIPRFAAEKLPIMAVESIRSLDQ